MNHDFLLAPPSLKQAFESGDSAGGGGGGGQASRFTRRSFIKRTGGATVAAMVAWNAMHYQAGAAVTLAEGGSGIGSGVPNWKIRGEAINKPYALQTQGDTRISTGAQSRWLHNSVDYWVRKMVGMQYYALETSYDTEATVTINVFVFEWAQIADPINGLPGPYRWMTQAERCAWLNCSDDPVDTLEVSTSIKKSIDPTTRAITHEGSILPNQNGVVSENGLVVTLEWTNDTLEIEFMSEADSIGSNMLEVEAVFTKYNFGGRGS